MANKCEVCTEKCPQAERAHQAALGRMYATKELVTLLKKVESGELVEVVRCKDCKNYCNVDTLKGKILDFHWCNKFGNITKEDDFCSYGERRYDNGKSTSIE